MNEDADATLLPEWFAPTDRDVICGWARQNHRHAGNQRFRQLVEQSAPLYVAARTKLEKTQVIAALVQRVRNESPGGGFVKRDFHSGRWYEIGDDKARDKASKKMRVRMFISTDHTRIFHTHQNQRVPHFLNATSLNLHRLATRFEEL